MADLTPDEIQYENARLTRAQWAAESQGEPIPTQIDTTDFPTVDTATPLTAPEA